jgi:hypothetical protein
MSKTSTLVSNLKINDFLRFVWCIEKEVQGSVSAVKLTKISKQKNYPSRERRAKLFVINSSI